MLTDGLAFASLSMGYRWGLGDTVDGNPAKQLRLGVFPVIYRVLCIPGG